MYIFIRYVIRKSYSYKNTQCQTSVFSKASIHPLKILLHIYYYTVKVVVSELTQETLPPKRKSRVIANENHTLCFKQKRFIYLIESKAFTRLNLC